jgi:hypothetical protein
MSKAIPSAVVLVGLSLLAIAPSRATVIDFEDVELRGPFYETLLSHGFTFTSEHFHVWNGEIGEVSSGSNYLLEEGSDRGHPIEMSFGGNEFALLRFDGSELRTSFNEDRPNAHFIDVLGVRADNSTVFQRFVLDGIADGEGGADDFQRFEFLPSFTNLIGAIFSGSREGGSSGGIAFDNVEASSVPEPGSLALFGFGLLAACTVARRKR